MLKKLVIKNVNSIKKCEIDFVKGNYKFAEENVHNGVVNPIAIYGHNGSGKSAVMNAIGHFVALMSYPAESLAPFTVNQILFDEYTLEVAKNSSKIIASIQLLFDIDHDEYEYYIETSALGYITNEYLKKNGICYFERDKEKFSYEDKESKLSNISRLIPQLRSLASSEINDATIQVVYAYISSITFVNLPYINRGAFVTSKLFLNTNINDLLVQKSKTIRDMLSEDNCFPRYTIEKNNKIFPNGLQASQYSLVLEDKDFKKKLPLEMISVGMKNLSILLSLLLSVPKNGVVFIDEVDAALHPSTLNMFLKIIRKNSIQVVFTIHNTNALQSMRPDQVYFAKWAKGFSNYYRLSKIYPNIREINNIEKMYLSSTFDEEMKEDE